MSEPVQDAGACLKNHSHGHIVIGSRAVTKDHIKMKAKEQAEAEEADRDAADFKQ